MDANASSRMWFSKGQFRRTLREQLGRDLEEWIVSCESDVSVLNEPSVYCTFSGPRGDSDIHVTLSTISRMDIHFEWEVKPNWCINDHNAILIRMWHGVNEDADSVAPLLK